MVGLHDFFKQIHCSFRFGGEVMTQNCSSCRNFVISARLARRPEKVGDTRERALTQVHDCSLLGSREIT